MIFLNQSTHAKLILFLKVDSQDFRDFHVTTNAELTFLLHFFFQYQNLARLFQIKVTIFFKLFIITNLAFFFCFAI
jgi:hypothetical protein